MARISTGILGLSKASPEEYRDREQCRQRQQNAERGDERRHDRYEVPPGADEGLADHALAGGVRQNGERLVQRHGQGTDRDPPLQIAQATLAAPDRLPGSRELPLDREYILQFSPPRRDGVEEPCFQS